MGQPLDGPSTSCHGGGEGRGGGWQVQHLHSRRQQILASVHLALLCLDAAVILFCLPAWLHPLHEPLVVLLMGDLLVLGQVGANGVIVVEHQLVADVALVEELLRHGHAVLCLVLSNRDTMSLDSVVSQLVESELLIADRTLSDDEVLGLAADLDPTSLDVQVMVGRQLLQLDALLADNAGLEVAHHVQE